MSRDETDDRQEEYAGWELPGQSSEDEDGPGGEAAGPSHAEEEPVGPPPKMRDQILRDRIRDRLGVTPRQWYVVETVLLVLPYPLFVFVYLNFDVAETPFLLVTLGYSLVAMYFGLLS